MSAALWAKHERAVLQFSGGKDSLACLYLIRPYWDKTTVVWVNTGAAYPEVIAQMAKIKAMVPHFVEANSNAIEWVMNNGAPSDVVPVASTSFAQQFKPSSAMLVQSWCSCCAQNIWEPLYAATMAVGATLLIRGQRNDDDMRSDTYSGDIIDGMELHLPLQEWSKEDVFDYLDKVGADVPEYYAHSDTSLDCWHCTAFLEERKRELAYMKHELPDKWKAVQEILTGLQQAITQEASHITDVLEG